jgi:hypothetical protein
MSDVDRIRVYRSLNLVGGEGVCGGELLHMTDIANADFLDAVRRNREALQQQIRQGQITIEKSQALLQRMEEIIAKADKKEVSIPRQSRGL